MRCNNAKPNRNRNVADDDDDDNSSIIKDLESIQKIYLLIFLFLFHRFKDLSAD
jgi:hypothetical protein